MNPALLSSKRTDWRTPEALYRQLDREFGFHFDPCPPEPDFDGLSVAWGQSNFVNTPYGRELPKWIAKAHAEALLGKTVVLLIPSRTDTRWWHDHVMQADWRDPLPQRPDHLPRSRAPRAVPQRHHHLATTRLAQHAFPNQRGLPSE